jgi:uncharacterized protein (TIGR04255 family)
MDHSPHPHPRFDKPPVIETVFSIEFAPLSEWTIPYFGLYWSTIRDRYPKHNVQPLVISQIENLSERVAPQKPVEITISEGPAALVRCWFFNEPETELVQIQRDRFIFNWKKGLVDQPYPHYDVIRPALIREWNHFEDFVDRNKLGKKEIRQCEVIYINHIDLGVGWKSYGELNSVLAPWSGATSGCLLENPEDIEIGARYRLPEGRGRMHIKAQPAIRNIDHKEIIQLTLTARGRPASSGPSSALDWFDFVQPLVAQSFADFTTPKMHAIWGRRD